MVVSDELKEPIRSHHDINKDRAKYVTSATQHYDTLAKRAVKAAHTIDIYACSLDQVGLMEMRYLVKRTGGVIILADEFESDMFKKSFQKLFSHTEDEQLKMAFNGTLEVQTSRELKVCGAVGHLSSLGKKGSSVAETEIGIGGTSAWRMCGLDPTSTYALYFEVVNQQVRCVDPFASCPVGTLLTVRARSLSLSLFIARHWRRTARTGAVYFDSSASEWPARDACDHARPRLGACWRYARPHHGLRPRGTLIS
jgi:hypothetical protein